MKKSIIAGVLIVASQLMNGQVNARLQTYLQEASYNNKKQLSFIKLKEAPAVTEAGVEAFINTIVLDGANKVALLKVDRDQYGYAHFRYKVMQNGVAVYNKMIVAHCLNGQLVSLNGDLRSFDAPGNSFALSEAAALGNALNKVNAKKYKWENKAEEAHVREVFNKPDFSFYPTGTKVIYEKAGQVYNAWQFNIYAEEPLYRANVFVDAASGKVIAEQNLICTFDVPGTANTKYSGTRNITCDQNGASYRLRETQRGLGIETYNLNTSMNYTNTDFTNSSVTWTTTGNNQAAADAHWGAESTYDFYYNKFNINSIDNAGYKLVSYVHYGTSYNNAFWDGIRMTYGDGDNSSFTIFTALDVCGHEITHGLVSNTANLGGSGSDECDALNEGFADIFGTSIERYARSNNWDWIIGKDITPNNLGLRNMQNPNQFQQPDTYLGQYWDLGGEPHNNNGPCIRWYYLLVNGGSGVNDNNNSYNVNGLGNVDAEKIAYRALTTYFTPSTDYAEARAGAIQAAKDLFGSCSPQVQETANAWYAVGVGAVYSTTVIAPNFVADVTNFCSLPANVNFSNTSSNGINYTWYFGDGATSSTTNTAHTYTANGMYSVKLKATGCQNVLDSITKTTYIVVNTPNTPNTTDGSNCGPGQVTLMANGNAQLNWYASPVSTVVINTGSSFVTPTITGNTTYYVVNTVTNAPAFGGMLSNTGGGMLSNSAQWLNFDVLQNSTLNSVVVYALNAGNRTIQMRDAFANIIASTTVNLVAGTNTVTLNYALTPGTGYRLGLNPAATANLYRSFTGVSYPYNIGSCVNITGSSAGAGYYYWFYKWKVTQESCGSPMVAVTASILPQPAISIAASSTSMCTGDGLVTLTGSPAGGTFAGNGVTGSSFDPSTAAIGLNPVTYFYQDPTNGCTNSDTVNIGVYICTGLTKLSSTGQVLSVYPNPASSQVTIQHSFAANTILQVTDASGRLVLSRPLQQSQETIDINGLAKGMYLLQVTDASGKTLKTLKLVKD